MTAGLEQVQQQMERFRELLPGLLDEHHGHWAVVHHNELQTIEKDESTAFKWAVERYGPPCGYVVVEIAEETPTLLSAAVLFETP